MNPVLDQFLVWLAVGMALGFFVWRRFSSDRSKRLKAISTRVTAGSITRSASSSSSCPV